MTCSKCRLFSTIRCNRHTHNAAWKNKCLNCSGRWDCVTQTSDHNTKACLCFKERPQAYDFKITNDEEGKAFLASLRKCVNRGKLEIKVYNNAKNRRANGNTQSYVKIRTAEEFRIYLRHK
jgi:hypothetical protein